MLTFMHIGPSSTIDELMQEVPPTLAAQSDHLEGKAISLHADKCQACIALRLMP